MQQEVANLRSDLIGCSGNLTFTIAQLTALFLQRLGPSDIAISAQEPDLFGKPIDLRPQIVAFGGDLSTLFVELGNLRKITQCPFVAATGKRSTDSVIVRTDSADIDHGSEP
jgi:hypothetical protein